MKYYSEKTKQFYNDVEALHVDEQKYDKEHAEEITAKQERDNDYQAIQTAIELYKKHHEKRIENDVKELKAIQDLKDEFIKKYAKKMSLIDIIDCICR